MDIKQMPPYFWIPICAMFFFFGCNEDSNKKEITRIVTEWQDKQIFFPEDIVFTRYGEDAIQYNMPESDYKILLYVDSVGCTSCKLQLHKWSNFIEEVDSLTSGKVPIIFFFHPKDKRELTYLLKRDEIKVPVCIDDEDQLNGINSFPSRDDFQCFLLDRNNKVVYIGNPIYNPGIKEMYLSRLAPESYSPPSSSKKTVIETEETEFDLGTLKHGEPVAITAKIHNVGDSPLIIYDTRASCGCTSISYSKEPTPPDASIEIEITYNAEDKGYFNKTVSIYANTEVSPVIIRLKGVVDGVHL